MSHQLIDARVSKGRSLGFSDQDLASMTTADDDDENNNNNNNDDNSTDDNTKSSVLNRQRSVLPPSVPSNSPGGLSRAFTSNNFGKVVENIQEESQLIPYEIYKDVVTKASELESERDELKSRLDILTMTTKTLHVSVKRTLMTKIKAKDEYIERCLQLLREGLNKSALEAELVSILQKSKAESINAEKIGASISSVESDNTNIQKSEKCDDSTTTDAALALCRAKLSWMEKRNKVLKLELKRFGTFHDEVAQVLKQPVTSEKWDRIKDALLRAENGTVLADDVDDEEEEEEEEMENAIIQSQREHQDSHIDSICRAELRLSTSLNVELATSQGVQLAKKEVQLLKDSLSAERQKNTILLQSIDSLKDENETLKESLASALFKVKSQTSLMTDVSKSGASLVERETSLVAELSLAQNEVKEVREQISKINQRLEEEIETRITLQNRLEGEQERNSLLTAEFDVLRETIRSLEVAKSNLSNAEADVSSLRTEVQELKMHNINMKRTLETKQDEIAALEKSIQEANTGRSTAEADFEKVKAHSKAQLVKLQKQATEQFDALKSLAVKEKEDAVNMIEKQLCLYKTKFTSTIQETIELKKMNLALRHSSKALIDASKTESLNVIRDLYSRAAPAIEGYNLALGRLKIEMNERRRLFNLVQELRGNIRVICRVRPPVSTDSGSGEIAVSFPSQAGGHEEGEHEEITVVNNNRTLKTWEFDSVFQPGSTNKDVFGAVESLVTSVADGFNVCIFAYGQTGSGKTHTMEGSLSNPGINYRTLEALFALKATRARDVNCSISISLLEIYNEQLRDMMATVPKGSNPEPLVIRDSGGVGGVAIPGLTILPVSTHEEVLHLMNTAYKNRTTFSTNMNEHSSRSHCVLSIIVTSFNKVTNISLKGKLHLIDLAGSERVGKSGATGDRLKEAQAINKSLSALGDVIQARGEKKSHIPFRNSVLTHLLSDSLSGDAKTLMVVNVSPSLSSSEETFCSLNFAARVRMVELGAAKKNVIH